MRQRITFVHKPGTAVDPASLQVSDSFIKGPVFEAAREERITLALDELPSELRDVVSSCHELHVRWVSPNAYETVAPLLSRLSPGLHVFYTPQKDSLKQGERVCAVLKYLFGRSIDCSSPEASFTTLPNERFSHSTAFQYHSPLDNLERFIQAVVRLCPNSDPSCETRVKALEEATSLDVSYDTISHALKLTATWPLQERPLLVSSTSKHRTEVGILSADNPPNLEPYELGISGLLTVLGQDSKPSATLFSFPSRHRQSGSTFSSDFLEPAGLHPTLQLRVSSPKPPSDDSFCALHAYFTLPRTIFADRYQLSDPLFMASKNLTALRYMSQPVDLEAPEYLTKLWGSAVLLELSPPSTETQGSWTAEVPLHLRYLKPAPGGYEDTEVSYPAVFWACATEEGTKFPNNPFERVNLGYDGLFGPRTVFWHVDPKPARGERLMSEITVPVLDYDGDKGWGGVINAGTAAVVLLGFAWVVWRLLSVLLRTGYGSAPAKKAEDKKKQ
ncbi:putative protein pbn1 protein [Phaeoacremonium minimum UCRPA7]|uniref:Protein PBN1 n=1 Tax=Phaeoacremonium minimum (strain UCR-PA7) TaxID=1286976 RepID=R8BFM8_PHAM7|nr:putative protein pbn1 protein [Phaeoacremonium minimum UCRPA7]EON98105.1 putative protein pbn1 protein [Phaeoacremonium minimum UCRPA7]